MRVSSSIIRLEHICDVRWPDFLLTLGAPGLNRSCARNDFVELCCIVQAAGQNVSNVTGYIGALESLGKILTERLIPVLRQRVMLTVNAESK